MGCNNSSPTATNASDPAPTLSNAVEYTRCGSSFPLLAKRKKPVSMPQVSTTSASATQA